MQAEETACAKALGTEPEKEPLRLENGGQRAQWQDPGEGEMSYSPSKHNLNVTSSGKLSQAPPPPHPVRIYCPSSVVHVSILFVLWYM